jgi:hypothetical protein
MRSINSNKMLSLEDLFIKCQSTKLGAIYINQNLYDEVVDSEPEWFDPCVKLSIIKKYSYSNILFVGWIKDDTEWKCEVYIII